MYHFVENKRLYTRKELTREDVIENYSDFIEVNGRFPTSREQRYTSESGLYSASSVLKVFDNIQELKDILGFTKEKELEEENKEALDALKTLYDKEGTIDSRSIDKSSVTRSVKFYSNRFGSLSNAYKLAGIDMSECRLSIPIVQLSRDGEFVKEWKSATEAHRKTGISNGNISHALKGRNPAAGGYKWMYKEDYEKLNKTS